jgi:hypothetical protein
MFAMTRTTPATVPVRSNARDERVTFVLFAGMKKSSVLAPLEKRTRGSSVGIEAFGVNRTFTVPETSAW